jgi:hypothetical protein
MLVISLGTLLILGGVALMAEQTIWGGRLGCRLRRSAAAVGTLGPQECGDGSGLAIYWSGFAMAALGTLLLLTVARR